MKEKIVNVKITCDKCNKEISFLDGTKYPYDKGWCYIYSFQGRIGKKSNHRLHVTDEKVQFNDLHFCSGKCASEFIADIIAVSMKPQDEELYDEEPTNKEREITKHPFEETEIPSSDSKNKRGFGKIFSARS